MFLHSYKAYGRLNWIWLCTSQKSKSLFRLWVMKQVLIIQSNIHACQTQNQIKISATSKYSIVCSYSTHIK